MASIALCATAEVAVLLCDLGGFNSNKVPLNDNVRWFLLGKSIVYREYPCADDGCD